MVWAFWLLFDLSVARLRLNSEVSMVPMPPVPPVMAVVVVVFALLPFPEVVVEVVMVGAVPLIDSRVDGVGE